MAEKIKLHCIICKKETMHRKITKGKYKGLYECLTCAGEGAVEENIINKVLK